MDIYIMTRGTQIDYMFLGTEPKQAWWTKFREWTSFEYPTIIFQASKLYLSGIPSKRKDRVKTPIRYTLVFEKVGREDIEKLRKLIKPWLNDIIIGDGDPVSSELGEYLDKKFTEEYTDNILLKLKNINDEPKKLRKLIKSWLNDIIIDGGDPVSSDLDKKFTDEYTDNILSKPVSSELVKYLDKKFTDEYTDNILSKSIKITNEIEKMKIHNEDERKKIHDEIIKKISDIFEYDYNKIEPENDHWICVSEKKKKGLMSFVNAIEQGIDIAAYLNLVDGKNIHSVSTDYPKAAILIKKIDKDNLIKPKKIVNNDSIPKKIIKETINVINVFRIAILAISIILNIVLLMQKHPDVSEANFSQKYPYVSEIEISLDPYAKKDIKGIDLKIIFKNTASIPTIKNQGIETEKEWDTNKQILSFQTPQKSHIKISNVKNALGIMHPFKISFYKKADDE